MEPQIEGFVFIVAPDIYLTIIDSKKRTTLWRDKEVSVEEPVGLSTDGTKFIACK